MSYMPGATPTPVAIGPVPTPQPPSGATYTPQNPPITYTTSNPPPAPQPTVLGQTTQTPTPAPSNPLQSSVANSQDPNWILANYPGYAGWNPTDMVNDFRNTGGSGKGGGGPSAPSAPSVPTYNIRGTGIQAPTPQAALNQALPSNDFANYASEFNNDPSAFLASIEQQYGQQEQALSQQESALKAAQEAFGKTVESDYATGLSRASGSKQKAESSLQQNTVQAEQRKQDALNAARKLYQEMQMGFRQRFGGATSAGEAAQAILGTEQQRQAGSIGRDYQNTVSQIQAQKVDLENNYQTMLQDLAGQKQRSLAELQNNFMNSLNQINANRTQSIAAREEAKRGVLMQMRNEAFAIAQQAQANQQQLEAMKLQAQLQLDSQLKLVAANAAKGSSLVDQFSGRTSTIGTNITPANTTATTNVSTAPQNALSSAVGQMSSAVYPIATTADGRTRYSDGSIR